MNGYLILRLAGPLQAWGLPTFEGTRPTARLPTRSGLLGLLGACLGIQRDDKTRLMALANSVRFAVRCDAVTVDERDVPVTSLLDYHTVLGARQGYGGLKSHETIQTWREYLCDALFTVAVYQAPDAKIPLDVLEKAVKKPHFTPFLGRRSCPLTQPLFRGAIQAADLQQALADYPPGGGDIYCEDPQGESTILYTRDAPLLTLPRQFTSHKWHLIKGGRDVPQQNCH